MYRIPLLLLHLAFVVSLARGDVIFSNLGPGDSFEGGIAYLVFGPTSIFSADLDIAAPFFGVAQPGVLTHAELALGHSTLSGNNELLVQVWSDSNGLPGTMLVSTMAQVPSAAATLVTADFSASPLTLQAGVMYWLVAEAVDDGYLSWSWNNTGDEGVVAARRKSDPLFTEWVVELDLGVIPAFRISGNVVPEPSGLMLAVVAMAAGLSRARRRPAPVWKY